MVEDAVARAEELIAGNDVPPLPEDVGEALRRADRTATSGAWAERRGESGR